MLTNIIVQFCTSMISQFPIIPALPPAEMNRRCISFYAQCANEKDLAELRLKQVVTTSPETRLSQCADERKMSDY